MTETKEVIKEKMNYFLENHIKVHISKITKEYINGLLIDKNVSNDIYTVSDEYGKRVIIFLSEIFDVREWHPKEDLK